MMHFYDAVNNLIPNNAIIFLSTVALWIHLCSMLDVILVRQHLQALGPKFIHYTILAFLSKFLFTINYVFPQLKTYFCFPEMDSPWVGILLYPSFFSCLRK